MDNDASNARIRKIKIAARQKPHTIQAGGKTRVPKKRAPIEPDEYGIKRRIPLEEQFKSKYEVTDIYPRLVDGSTAKTPCWRWIGANNGKPEGKWYGIFGRPKMYAHRYAYQKYRGPIGLDKVIDHLCRHRWCVNPDHLDAITNVNNLKRGAHPNFVSHRTGKCARGLHDLNDPDNVYLRADGRAFCKRCYEIARDKRLSKGKKKKSKFNFINNKPKSPWGLLEE